jgi:ATP-independent RNA helicase DbpA
MTSSLFSSLKLNPAQLDALTGLGYSAMTPVQAQSLPAILQRRDVIIQAATGSGKTAAFAIGLLHHLNPRFFGVQALVMCPTRELAEQVGKAIRQLASRMSNVKTVMLCGGKPFGSYARYGVRRGHGGHHCTPAKGPANAFVVGYISRRHQKDQPHNTKKSDTD